MVRDSRKHLVYAEAAQFCHQVECEILHGYLTEVTRDGIHTSAMLGLLLWHDSLKSLIFNKVSYIVTFPWALQIRWKKTLDIKMACRFLWVRKCHPLDPTVAKLPEWNSDSREPGSLGDHSQKHNRTQDPSTRNLCGQVACHIPHLVSKLGAFPIAVPGPRVQPG